MERPRITLTPEQQDFLAALSRETGKTIPALIAEALEGLVAQVRPAHGTGETNGTPTEDLHARSAVAKKHIWEIADDLLAGVPDEALDRLPSDGAAEHDHYIYGTPKRSA